MKRDVAESALKACIDLMGKAVGEIDGLMKAAKACVEAGQVERAFHVALDIEPILSEANYLLQAAAVIRRQIDKDG